MKRGGRREGVPERPLPGRAGTGRRQRIRHGGRGPGRTAQNARPGLMSGDRVRAFLRRNGLAIFLVVIGIVLFLLFSGYLTA